MYPLFNAIGADRRIAQNERKDITSAAGGEGRAKGATCRWCKGGYYRKGFTFRWEGLHLQEGRASPSGEARASPSSEARTSPSSEARTSPSADARASPSAEVRTSPSGRPRGEEYQLFTRPGLIPQWKYKSHIIHYIPCEVPVPDGN